MSDQKIKQIKNLIEGIKGLPSDDPRLSNAVAHLTNAVAHLDGTAPIPRPRSKYLVPLPPAANAALELNEACDDLAEAVYGHTSSPDPRLSESPEAHALYIDLTALHDEIHGWEWICPACAEEGGELGNLVGYVGGRRECIELYRVEGDGHE